MSTFDKIAEYIQGQGGKIVLEALSGGRWVIAVEFGWESEDSPMVGGAAYAHAPSLDKALSQIATDMGL